MPGRLAIYDDISFKKDIINTFDFIDDKIQRLNKRYNIAPTIQIPVYLNTKVYTYAHFGLIPSWAKDRSSMNINARSETIFEKKSFREAYKQRRCLIPLNGWYEWTKNELANKSIPNIIIPKDKNYFAIAGIYEQWYDNATRQIVLSCALITTKPNKKISAIHDRMPVILQQKDWQKWLNNNTTYEELNTLFKPYSSDKTDIYEVNEIVNSVANDKPSCIKKSCKLGMIQGSLF